MKLIWALALTVLASACSSGDATDAADEPQDDHFTCAALISAANDLQNTGRLPAVPPLEDGLLAMMSHFNAWAIPEKISEPEASERVKKERDRLLSALKPEEILARAIVCIDRTPAT